MKKKKVQKLKLGLYEIFWKSGGSSLAAVGNNADGSKWFAPIDFFDPPGYDWKRVKRVKEISSGEQYEGRVGMWLNKDRTRVGFFLMKELRSDEN